MSWCEACKRSTVVQYRWTSTCRKGGETCEVRDEMIDSYLQKKHLNVFVSQRNLLFRFLSEEMQLLEEVGLSQRHSYNRARLFRKSNE